MTDSQVFMMETQAWWLEGQSASVLTSCAWAEAFPPSDLDEAYRKLRDMEPFCE
jgi:hypothetical protein